MLPRQSTTQGKEIEGYPQSCVAPIDETVDGGVCPLAATIVLVVHKKDTTDTHTECIISHSEKVILLQKKREETHPHPTHCIFHIQHMHVA
jgi:hypothetical protein